MLTSLVSYGYRRSIRRIRIGTAIEAISNTPTKTLITMPGTFISDSPNVIIPSTNTAMKTPEIVPDPPMMLTPPSTTMVITSNSQPAAMFGRVLPILEVYRGRGLVTEEEAAALATLADNDETLADQLQALAETLPPD